MMWYQKLSKQQKLKIREVFELATGLSLNNALKIFTFVECMDILHEKLVMVGILND